VSTTTTAIDWQAGPRLRAWLEEQDPPRPADIARKAGVSKQFIHTILAGHAKPSPRVVQACSELGIPVDEVIFRSH
jgi:transcriptional regulator with XRE-family HTH domain